jgi:heme/copper-type cytochrome/quinol oxidase subunit 1
MRWIDRLSKAQRVVVVIALAIALGAIASYLTSLGVRFGWYAYSPLTGQQYQPPPGNGLPGWLRLIIWLAATGLWALASVIALRPSPGQAAPD